MLTNDHTVDLRLRAFDCVGHSLASNFSKASDRAGRNWFLVIRFTVSLLVQNRLRAQGAVPATSLAFRF
jgi:hypothetical protein